MLFIAVEYLSTLTVELKSAIYPEIDPATTVRVTKLGIYSLNSSYRFGRVNRETGAICVYM